MSALDDVADELYGLPLDQFTARRNELATELRSENRGLADDVRRLGKPSVAAWVVNMFGRRRRDRLGELMALGTALREAHEELDRDALIGLATQRRRVVEALARDAVVLAEELGQRVTRPVLDEVAETFQAALTDETAAAAVLSGRLLRSLLAVGTEVDVTDAVAVPGALRIPATPTPANVVDLQTRRELAGARKEVAEAKNAVAAAERARDAARARLDENATRRGRAEDELADLEERVAALTRVLGDLGRDRRALQDALQVAEEAFKKARAEADLAASRLARLDRG